MEEKQTFWKKLTAFVSGKGFYAVLGLCLVIIAASAWTLIGTLQGTGDSGAVYDSGEITAREDSTPAPTVRPTVTESPKQTQTMPRSTPTPAPETTEIPEAPEEETTVVQEEPTDGESTQEEEITEEVNAASVGWIWPVNGEVVLEYAEDYLVWNRTMADWRTHPAVDIAAAMGTRVLAVSGGTVKEVGEDDLLGTYVIVEHGEGVESVYANLAATPAVEAGAYVEMGDVLGSVGDTALGEIGEEAHLHFAMTQEDTPVDPAAWLPNR